MQIEYTPGQSEAETAIIHTRWLQHRRIVHRRNRIVVLLALLAVIAVLADLFSGTAASKAGGTYRFHATVHA